MKKYAKYATTSVKVCKKPVKNLQKLCIYKLFTHFLHTFYRLYWRVTHFTYFLIKEHNTLIKISKQVKSTFVFVKLFHITVFKQPLSHYLSSQILNYEVKFPLPLFLGGFCHA